jgi:SAM-dependent methyltransferase
MSTDRIASFFDAYASDFEAIYGNRNTPVNRVVNTLFRRSMRLRYELTLAGCDPLEGRTVLDIGCGPGHYSVELARRGARRVLGIDFAAGMLELAAKRADVAGVGARCEFRRGDFLADHVEPHDYAIAMGFMDYVQDARTAVDRVLAVTRRRAFFSFPADGGVLAWQRKLRYRSRCPLYMYGALEVRTLFEGRPGFTARVQPIARDFFVTAEVR